MKKNEHSLTSSENNWDIQEELDDFRHELESQFKAQEEMLLQELHNATQHLEDLSLKTIEKTHSEWNECEQRLKSTQLDQADQIEAFRSTLVSDKENQPDLENIVDWVFNAITKPEK